jgi:hypothetical protein
LVRPRLPPHAVTVCSHCVYPSLTCTPNSYILSESTIMRP